jgi:hypothetical protein
MCLAGPRAFWRQGRYLGIGDSRGPRLILPCSCRQFLSLLCNLGKRVILALHLALQLFPELAIARTSVHNVTSILVKDLE